ncbi:DUF3263 domain-containing protein [Mycobacteroides franklinii]|uniref:DUF3263 domain-containing protein n=1 Tax=Mycobacteroides franklinii TaxID=948102 RepID=UPI0038B3EB45
MRIHLAARRRIDDEAIRSKSGRTPDRCYQQLNRILDGGDALKDDPITVKRPRRIELRNGRE